MCKFVTEGLFLPQGAHSLWVRQESTDGLVQKEERGKDLPLLISNSQKLWPAISIFSQASQQMGVLMRDLKDVCNTLGKSEVSLRDACLNIQQDCDGDGVVLCLEKITDLLSRNKNCLIV